MNKLHLASNYILFEQETSHLKFSHQRIKYMYLLLRYPRSGRVQAAAGQPPLLFSPHLTQLTWLFFSKPAEITKRLAIALSLVCNYF